MKDPERGLRYFPGNLLFPPRCMNCRELLSVPLLCDCRLPLCPSCVRLWEGARREICPDCRLSVSSCTCMPTLLTDAGFLSLRKLIRYRADAGCTVRQMVFSLKHHGDRLYFSFVARALAGLLREEIGSRDLDPGDIRLVPLPRSAVNRAKDGFDQAEKLAAVLGREVQIPCVRALRRRLFSGKQAKKGKDDREKNASGAFCLVRDASSSLAGKTVVLVDDIVTTGASMAQGAALCRAAGASAVFGLCVGMTASDRKKAKKEKERS